jgi:hypothetical protein
MDHGSNMVAQAGFHVAGPVLFEDAEGWGGGHGVTDDAVGQPKNVG